MNNNKKPDRNDRNNIDPFDFFNRFFNRKSTDNFFDLFEEHIRQMQEEMDHKNVKPGDNPRIYGWSYHMGPDGRPHYQEFSNVDKLPNQRPNKRPAQVKSEKREPYIDVIEDEKEVYVTVEIPGVKKDNIDVELTKDTLILTIDHPERGIRKHMDLPSEVNKKPVEATYNNGILSITLKKRKTRKKGNKIDID